MIKIGDKYNYLTILSEEALGIYSNGRAYRIVKCQCVCGKIKDISFSNLKRGHTKSCGCIRKIHGMRNTKIYGIWQGIKKRCNDKMNHRYGGRGISYDPKWEKFENFYEDMKEGYLDKLTIDRRENDGNYCKDNCRWITIKEQIRNKGNNILYKGKCISEWCEDLGLNYSKIIKRISYYKWDIEKALELNNK